MNLYAIMRRSGWASGDELESGRGALDRGRRRGMPDDVRWIRSYVLDEGDGTLGTVCIYEATSPEAIRRARGSRRPAGRRDHPDRGHRDRPPGPAARGRLAPQAPQAF